MNHRLLCVVAFACCIWTMPAAAQLRRGDFRLSLDVDMISVAHVGIDPDGPNNDHDVLVFGIGPNQLGGSRVTAVTTPVGLGFGWVLTPKLILGIRTGLGFDVLARDADDDTNIRILSVSLMPGIEFVPIGQRAKLFLAARPLFQANRTKRGRDTDRWLQGGFSLGVGTYIFPAPSVSVDLGFFFEGRFGSHKRNDDESHEDVRDLRGVVRFGLSLWR